MSTVHTEYGPGRIIAQETVRGRTRFKVAGEGFEVWLDQTKLGGYEPPAQIDYDAPHWDGHGPGSELQMYPAPGEPLSDDEYADYADPRGHLDRGRMRTHPDYLSDDDPDARYARRQARGPRVPLDEWVERETHNIVNDDPYADDDYDYHGEASSYAPSPGELHFDDDPDARFANRRRQGGYAEDEMRGLSRGDYEGYDDEYDPGAEYRHLQHDPGLSFDDDADSRYAKRVMPGKAGKPSHLAWAPMDDDNSTALPYNPRPQHDAIGTPGDDDSATLQPIHHIDADERLHPSDSLSFDGEDDGEEPGPNPDLFAKQGAVPSPNLTKGLGQMVLDTVGLGDKINLHKVHDTLRDKVRDQVIRRTNNPELADKAVKGMDGGMEGGAAAGTIAAGEYALGRGLDKLDPGYDSGWGKAIKPASRRTAGPEMLLPLVGPALRTVAPMAINHLLNGGGHDSGGDQGGGSAPGVIDEMMSGTDPGSGWDGVIAEASYRPAGLSDRYIDITAGADYHNDPVAQFRHDPDAYINRIGHLMDEGLNPRFAEYMDLVEGDSSVRTAAWKDVRAKAMRLKTSGAVHVKDIAPSRIMASVDGDHGTYDVVILKGASYGDQSIANWHCACEWGKWAFKRKFTYVGRLCSHAYASYLTMQSAAMKGQKPTRRGPSDMVIKRRDPRDRQYPTPVFAAGLRTADALQNGPERLVPELAVNDTDDAQMFLDVEKDERTDTGPDDVVSDKDIVHFARLMRHCEVTEQPYPRHLVAFLARYAGCNDDSGDDTQADYRAHDADDADEYLTTIRSDADRKQEDDFGNMAERVHRIQDAVEEARAHGADADRLVAMVRQVMADNQYTDTVNTIKQQVPAPPPSNGPDISTLWRTPDDQNPAKGSRRTPDGKVIPDTAGPAEVSDATSSGNAYRTPEQRKIDRTAPGVSTPAPVKKPAAPSGESGSFSINLNNGQQQKPGAGASGAGASGANTPGGNTGAGASGAGNTGAGGAGGAKGYTAPGGGQTSGNVADGGVVGAENGNNKAITKADLDENGYYTMKDGDTLTDVAQRGYGDMNKYQDIANANKDSITNVDQVGTGTKIKLDGLTDIGNNGNWGNVTNPGGGGSDKNIATPDVDVSQVKGTDDGKPASSSSGTVSGTVGGGAATPPAPQQPQPTQKMDTSGSLPAKASRRTAKEWLRWAAEQDGTTTSPDQPADASVSTNPGTTGASGAGTGSRSAPATNPAQTTTPGSPSQSETFDPANPEDVEKQSVNSANPGAQAGGSNSPLPSSGASGMGMGDIGSMIGQGVGAATDIASGIGSALPGIASGIGNAISGIGSIFASKNDFDDWVRYAYPTGAGDDDDPKTLPHLPFNGSGNPGSLEFTTSEEYADKARKKMDDVTDLGDDPLSTPMGKWQRQSRVAGHWLPERSGPPADNADREGPLRSYDPHAGRQDPDSYYDEDRDDEDDFGGSVHVGYSTEDDSDIVRTFQAHLGETALGAGAGSGRFDDIAGAAQGFLRTAGRNYSLAEQSELIREGDKGGARNLDSLDLKGTHYEDMHTLGW